MNEKKDAVYYHGKQGVLKTLTAMTSPAAAAGKTTVIITTEAETGNKFVYKTYAAAKDKPAVTFGTALTGWADITSGGTLTPTSGHGFIAIAEIDAENNPVGVCTAAINL